MLLNLVIIFTSLVIIIFASILSYSKAYKVKNRIVEVIEKYGVYDDSVVGEINSNLNIMGYDVSNPTKCDGIKERLVGEKYSNLSDNLNTKNGYNYCVFEVELETGKYYVVVSFIHFQVPVIGDILTFPVYSETQIIGKKYNYQKGEI